MEHPPSSSGCHRTDSDTTTDRRRYAVAEPNASVSRGGRGSHNCHPRADGLRETEGAALDCSFFANPDGYSPDGASDTATATDSHDCRHADAYRQSDDISMIRRV
jgi:hypothetical protein